MNIWINKCHEEEVSSSYLNAHIFNIYDKNNESNLKTNIEEIWKQFKRESLKAINEDLLIIALSVFAVDKRIFRRRFQDCWTRELQVSIPVIELEKWNLVKEQLEEVLNFLSGDRWSIEFRRSKFRYGKQKIENASKIEMDFDGVCLFSGGLDSFSGAIHLLEKNKRICFTGFREYGSLANRQTDLYNILKDSYPEMESNLILFNGTPYAPEDIEKNKIDIPPENTSRSRSLLFLAGALGIASLAEKNIPVYIPENGFIGINVPLTDSRKGSSSTRTTHLFFIRKLNEILAQVGILNRIENFYVYKTKGEIVAEIVNTKAFKKGAESTISCSHPCHARYSKKSTPMNCGYCYPCIIRKASMNSAGAEDGEYNIEDAISIKFINENFKLASKGDDLKAVLWSLNRYLTNKDNKLYLKSLIMQTGELTDDEVSEAYRVYVDSMEEIKEMVISESQKYGVDLLEYVGIEE
ncbi:MAG TPA: hypothetical protein GX707_12410 [Epulopiscium sp.]|nr:hypothetical protein [Candidatus Epulonipiscium sp.]